jgi:hypothetical protein
MVLGMSFCVYTLSYQSQIIFTHAATKLVRNVYMLMNYGDFIIGTTDRADPYVQFLSTTDPAEGISIIHFVLALDRLWPSPSPHGLRQGPPKWC